MSGRHENRTQRVLYRDSLSRRSQPQAWVTFQGAKPYLGSTPQRTIIDLGLAFPVSCTSLRKVKESNPHRCRWHGFQDRLSPWTLPSRVQRVGIEPTMPQWRGFYRPPVTPVTALQDQYYQHIDSLSRGDEENRTPSFPRFADVVQHQLQVTTMEVHWSTTRIPPLYFTRLSLVRCVYRTGDRIRTGTL